MGRRLSTPTASAAATAADKGPSASFLPSAAHASPGRPTVSAPTHPLRRHQSVAPLGAGGPSLRGTRQSLLAPPVRRQARAGAVHLRRRCPASRVEACPDQYRSPSNARGL